MITSGIERILISVSDMQESLAFYRDWVGLRIVADQQLEPDKIQQLWNLPKGTKARAVSLRIDEQPVLLTLIEFQPGSDTTIREGAKPWDYAFHHIAFYVKNMETVYQALIEKGFTFISAPLQYTPFPQSEVKEVFLVGPDDVRIDHVERLTPPIPEIKDNYGKILEAVLVVENMQATIRFYRDILGIPLLGDIQLPTGIADEVLALPHGTDIRFAVFAEKDNPAPILAAIEFSMKGKPLVAKAKPPHQGLFALSYATDDLSGLIEKCKGEKVKVLSGPVKLDMSPYGYLHAITIEGPGTELIEIFQK
jgi:catechol 2,3-dioxygenase-like lactoylglutathione lyase family enzyme